MEQIISLHKNFRNPKPFKIGSKRTIREIVQYLVMPLGYPLTFQSSLQIVQTSAVLDKVHTEKGVSQIIEQYTRNRIPKQEEQLRKKIAERWNLQKNMNQKQLDLYLPANY